MLAFFGRSDNIFDTVVDFLQEDKWNYTQIDGKPILKMGFTGSSGRWNCFARVDEESKSFVFYSVLDMNVQSDKLHSVAEFTCRANYGLKLGNFELDFSDGEIRYKTSIKAVSPTKEMIKDAIYVNIAMMDKYFPGLMAVMYGGSTPQQAIASVEASQMDTTQAREPVRSIFPDAPAVLGLLAL